jgi:hypothetical protein
MRRLMHVTEVPTSGSLAARANHLNLGHCDGLKFLNKPRQMVLVGASHIVNTVLTWRSNSSVINLLINGR